MEWVGLAMRVGKGLLDYRTLGARITPPTLLSDCCSLVKYNYENHTQTGAEFFARYPALHGFLLEQLQEAAAELEAASAAAAAAAAAAGSGAASRAAAALANPHPGLYPVLIILSRLKPSHIRDDDPAAAAPAAASAAALLGEEGADGGPAAEGGDGSGGGGVAAAATYMGALSPTVFTPLVRRCATAAPLAVRRLAARALAPLVRACGLACLPGRLACVCAPLYCEECCCLLVLVGR